MFARSVRRRGLGVNARLVVAASAPLLSLLALLLASAPLPAAAGLPPLPVYAGLELAYEDDFIAPELNDAVFTAADFFVQTPYAQVCYLQSNVALRDGLLVLTTRAQDVQCIFHDTGEVKSFSFSSGWVDTHGKLFVRDGLVEVSSRLPPAVERIWPAAWVIDAANNRDGLTGAPLCWPKSVELDIYEMTGGLGDSACCASVHHGVDCDVDLGNSYGCVPHPTDGAFHVWAVRWDTAAGSATWFLDGVAFFTSSTQSAPLPAGPVAFVLNTALSFFVGQGPAGVDATGVEHQIDWVRLWTRS